MTANKELLANCGGELFEAASSAGFREASVGQNILRAETAAIAGLAAAHLYFDRT